jgi:hypothetical protein
MTAKFKTFTSNHRIKRWLTLATALALTLIGGVLYGSYTQRWNRPVDLSAAAQQLERLPKVIGNWKAVEEIPVDDNTLQMLDCAGHVSRRYVNGRTGQSVQCAFFVGRPGPIAVHTPEVCFSSQAYEIQDVRTEARFDVAPSQRHSFWKVDFKTRNALADGLRVYYAWTAGNVWKASGSPRFEYAGEGLLYKCQVASELSPSKDKKAADPGRQFLEELVASAWPKTMAATPNRP